MEKFIVRPKCFAGYGLDSSRNFYEAPICPCGCGGKATLVAETEDVLYDFLGETLSDYDCDCCGFFAHFLDGKMMAGIKSPVEDSIKFFVLEQTHMDYFKDVAEIYGLHHYALLIQGADESWEFIEE